jgi:hypothetical protein
VKKWIFIFIGFLLSHTLLAQKIKFQRVCNGGNNNLLSWVIIPDGCVIVSPLNIFARDGISQPYTKIDSLINPVNKSYIHTNSNVPSSKPWQYYLQVKIYCGGPDTIEFNTDTLGIDDIKPDSTTLDSVSVDPITGVVYLAWISNKTPDFSSYYLYNYDRADPRLIENYKDTFYTDINPINPRSKSLSYDITSSDSCDNRRDYGNYKHQTIWLQGSIDTCLQRSSLSWTAYVGWGVSQYEIYKSENGGAYTILTILPSGAFTFTDNNLINSSTYSYFIRARKLKGNSSSSSNSTVSMTSGKSNNPDGTAISYVSTTSKNQIEISINRNPISGYSSIDLLKNQIGSSPIIVHTFSNSNSVFQDLNINETQTYQYQLLSKNVCGIITDTSAKSNNIVLGLKHSNAENALSWTRYFTWNMGVKEYIIYRSSGNSLQEAINFTAYQNVATDTFFQDNLINDPVNCYYILANESTSTNKSKSNIICYIKEGKVYYPNALTRYGSNTRFTFVGEGIDLEQSAIQIYNRWGMLEYSKENIISGWLGTNNNGEFVPSGVYFFMAQIMVGNEKIQINGNITVIQ